MKKKRKEEEREGEGDVFYGRVGANLVWTRAGCERGVEGRGAFRETCRMTSLD